MTDRERIRRSYAAAFSILFVIVAVTPWPTACTGMAPSRVAYNSITDATLAVQTAVRAADDANLITPQNRPQIQAAYEKYQKAANIAVDLSQQVADKTPVITIISNEANDVIALIKKLTGK
jgi:hypothetical protein